MSSVTLAFRLSRTLRWPKVKSVLRKVKFVFPKVTLIKWIPITKIWRHIIASTILTIIAIALSVVSTEVFVIKNVDFTIADSEFNSSVVFLSTDFIAVDATERTLTLDWYVGGCEIVADDTVNIYIDPNLLLAPDNSSDNQVPSVDLPSTPIFSVNCTELSNVDIPTSSPTFRTVNKLTGNIFHNGTNVGRSSSLQFYPFDKYTALFNMFAKTNSNSSVGIFMGNSITAPANFQIKVNTQFSGGDDQISTYVLNISRSTAVKALVIIIILANWFVTIAFMWITVASVIWPEGVVKELFVIPIASLFAFTAVRSNMPGAPSGFGSIVDHAGILPNLAIMTLCSAILLTVILFRRTREFPNNLEAPGKKVDSPTIADGVLVTTNPPSSAEIPRRDSMNQAPIVANAALVANPPLPAEIQRRDSTNPAPTVTDGALAAANPPPAAEIQRRDSTNPALTVTDRALAATNPPPAAEIQRYASTDDAPTGADGALAAANPLPPPPEIQRRDSTIEGLTIVDGVFIVTNPRVAEIQRGASMNDALTVVDGAPVAETPRPAAEIQRRNNTI